VYLGVFRRSALERVGGYDETFERAQDWEMNYRIRSTGGLVWFSPSLSVSYRPRSSLSTLAKQYFHYGRWRRQVIRAHPGSINFRYLAPPLALLGVVAGLVISTFASPWTLTVPAAYLLLTVAGSLVIGRGLPIGARLVLPIVIVTMHMAWGAGFLSSWRSVAENS
jgi:succinoglycan biosynthesis protein ExoA